MYTLYSTLCCIGTGALTYIRRVNKLEEIEWEWERERKRERNRDWEQKIEKERFIYVR